MRSWIGCFACVAALFISAVSADGIRPRNQCPGSLSIVYGQSYRLCQPLQFYADTALMPDANGTLKFKDGSYFFGRIITRSEEGLPDSFDMSDYPRALLGEIDPSGLSKDLTEKLKNTRAIFRDRLGNREYKKITENGITSYVIPSVDYTEIYMVKQGRSEEVLLMGFQRVTDDLVKTIVKGVQ